RAAAPAAAGGGRRPGGGQVAVRWRSHQSMSQKVRVGGRPTHRSGTSHPRMSQKVRVTSIGTPRKWDMPKGRRRRNTTRRAAGRVRDVERGRSGAGCTLVVVRVIALVGVGLLVEVVRIEVLLVGVALLAGVGLVIVLGVVEEIV